MAILLLVGCTRDTGPYAQAATQRLPLIINIDKRFTKAECKIIAHDLDSWTKASGGAIMFRIVWNKTEPYQFYKSEHPKNNQGIFVWKIDRHNVNQLSRKLRHKYIRFSGYYIPDDDGSANILVFSEFSNKPEVFLHEIGHLLGLRHSANFNTVMYMTANSDCITQEDATALCKLWGCIAHPGC